MSSLLMAAAVRCCLSVLSLCVVGLFVVVKDGDAAVWYWCC